MIECLTLCNFKSIKEGVFNLENLTLFSGLNGAGKSSIIQSMLLLRQSFEKHLLPDAGISLVGDYVQIGTGKDLLFADAEQDIVGVKIEWSTSMLDLQFSYIQSSDMQPKVNNPDSVEGAPYTEALFTSAFQYLSADRISPKSTYAVSDYTVNQRRSLGIKGEYTAHFLAANGNQEISIASLQHENSSTNLLIDNLNAWMSEITPGTKVVAKLIPEINQASLHYQFASATELTNEFRPENTGFGLTYVLPVVTAILSARTGDLLMIENPESHLHPAGQSLVAKLVSIASQNGVQIIVETHSDHFLNGVRKSVKAKEISSENVQIYFLSRSPESSQHEARIDEIQINETGRIEYWPSGFFDEWEKSLDALLSEE